MKLKKLTWKYVESEPKQKAVIQKIKKTFDSLKPTSIDRDFQPLQNYKRHLVAENCNLKATLSIEIYITLQCASPWRG